MDRTTDERSKLLSMEPMIRNQRVFRSNSEIVFHKLDNLIPFKNQPFALYEGQRFTDMVESMRANGIMVPIVVRPAANGIMVPIVVRHAEDGKYEILSGHNRVNAAKEAGFCSRPCTNRSYY